MGKVRPDEPAGMLLSRARVLGALFGDQRAHGRFGRFRVLDRLGAGAMGVVYAAYDPELDRGVALKLVNVPVKERGAALAEAKALTADANIVLRVDVETGHTVTFYEPTPGGLYLAERMVPGQTFALRDKEASDALAAFARLRPQAEVPAELQAAYDRARNLPSEPIALEAHAFGGGHPEAAQASPATPGVIEQGLTSSSSAANFVNNDGGCDWGPTWSFCRVNWGGGFFATTTSTSGLCTVDHYAGNGVTVQITVNGTILGSPFQNPGTIVQYSLGSSSGAVTRRIDITNASGDSFHAGCRWGN